MNPTSSPSFTSRPIHQLLSYFSCEWVRFQSCWFYIHTHASCIMHGHVLFIAIIIECHITHSFCEEKSNLYTLIWRKSLTLNEIADPCTGESSSTRPSYATFVLTAKATGFVWNDFQFRTGVYPKFLLRDQSKKIVQLPNQLRYHTEYVIRRPLDWLQVSKWGRN